MKTKAHSIRHLALIPLTVLCLSAGLSTAAGQGSIGVNFGSNPAGSPATLAPTDLAGAPGFAQVGYNTVTAAAAGLALDDSTSTLTTATLTTTKANSFSSITTSVAGADEVFNNNRANASASSWSFTVANIPYASYEIVVYDLEFTAGAELGIGVGGTTYYTSSPLYSAAGYLDDNAATPFTYTQGTSTVSGTPTANSDYVVFTGLTGGSQTVTLTGFGSGERVGGFQIVQVPEPSTWAAMGMGAGLLGLTLRRRVRRA